MEIRPQKSLTSRYRIPNSIPSSTRYPPRCSSRDATRARVLRVPLRTQVLTPPTRLRTLYRNSPRLMAPIVTTSLAAFRIMECLSYSFQPLSSLSQQDRIPASTIWIIVGTGNTSLLGSPPPLRALFSLSHSYRRFSLLSRFLNSPPQITLSLIASGFVSFTSVTLFLLVACVQKSLLGTVSHNFTYHTMA